MVCNLAALCAGYGGRLFHLRWGITKIGEKYNNAACGVTMRAQLLTRNVLYYYMIARRALSGMYTSGRIALAFAFVQCTHIKYFVTHPVY